MVLHAPAPLGGSPIFLPGSLRLPWRPRRSPPRAEGGVPTWPTRRLGGSTGCQDKPGRAGATFPAGLCTLQGMPQGLPQPRLTSGLGRLNRCQKFPRYLALRYALRFCQAMEVADNTLCSGMVTSSSTSEHAPCNNS